MARIRERVGLFLLAIWILVYFLWGEKACESSVVAASSIKLIPPDVSHHTDIGNTHVQYSSNSTLFPKRLISVFGLEKSGTTWTTLTIAKALNIVPETEHRFAYNKRSADKSIEVQHISQPWGKFLNQPAVWSCRAQNVKSTKTIFAAVPLDCVNHTHLAPRTPLAVLPEECKTLAHLNDFVQISSRFFVNITSHIQWYLDRGVDATAVILMRDQTIAHISKTKSICTNANISKAQNDYANKLTGEALLILPPERVVLVSFEGLLSLGMPYLQDIYRRLGIENATHVPDFQDANQKYIQTNLLDGGGT